MFHSIISFYDRTILNHDPILAKSIGSKDRTWKNLTVQASSWYVVSCSMGLDLQKLQNFLAIGSKGGPQWKNDFTEVPPLVHWQKKLCSFWRSRPLEHVSTYYGEAWTVKDFHVLYFDPIDFAKIGSCIARSCKEVSRLVDWIEFRCRRRAFATVWNQTSGVAG